MIKAWYYSINKESNKIDITEGAIKFRKRIKDKVPSGIDGGNLEEAKVLLAGIGRARNLATDFSLDDWQEYARLKGVPFDVNNIYLNDDIEEESRDRCMKLVPHGDKWVERLKFLESEGYFEDLLM